MSSRKRIVDPEGIKKEKIAFRNIRAQLSLLPMRTSFYGHIRPKGGKERLMLL